MTKAPDQNDQHKAGTLEVDPLSNVRAIPLNKAAQRTLDDAPRILTVREMLEIAARRARGRAKEEACTTGHYQLDDATGGVRPGKSWVFAAETSWGKSSWLVAVADENLRQGKRVLIVSSEDDEDTYGSRLLARRSRVGARRIRSGKLRETDSVEIDKAVEGGETFPAFLDARGRTCEWTAAQVDALIAKENVDLVAFDYLQEWSAAHNHENHRLMVKHVAGVLRKVVKLRNKASILFSQVTIDANAKSAFPNRNMIRDCRDVANAAEVILIGYTPEKAVMDGDNVLVAQGAKAIFVDKVKDGPKGFAVWAEWDDDTASFNRVNRPPGPYDEFDSIADEWQSTPDRTCIAPPDDDSDRRFP